MLKKFSIVSCLLLLLLQHNLYAQIPIEAQGGKFVQVIKANKSSKNGATSKY
jgi:hypothetical protein